MKKHRVFIAFPVSEEVKKELERIQSELKKINKKVHIRWTDSILFHVTIEFIGEIDENQIQVVKDILEDISKNQKPFKYWLDRMGAFPNKNSPNIIVARAKEEQRTGYKLHDELVDRMSRTGLIKNNQKWHPHITIGRNKRQEHVEGLHSLKMEKIPWEVDRIELIESELTPDGPMYTIIRRYNLIGN